MPHPAGGAAAHRDADGPVMTYAMIVDKGWICPMCTLINPGDRSKCDACNLDRCVENEGGAALLELPTHAF